MNRRDFLKSVCVGAAGLGLTGEYGAAKSGTSKPNVLFIAIDDMNDWMTLFDPKNPIKTPNLVRLAKRGMFFSKAYCAAPACCPSRAAIMTGIRPSNSGVYDNNNAWAKMMPDARDIRRRQDFSPWSNRSRYPRKTIVSRVFQDAPYTKIGKEP